MKNYNSSGLARQAAQKLKLGPDAEQALYEALSQLPDGPVKDAVTALSAQSPLHKYIAVVKPGCVRGTQYAIKPDADPLDDGAWVDAQYTPLYIGMIEAENEVRAKQLISVREHVDTSVIDVYLA